MPRLTQDQRQLAIETSLGKDVLLLSAIKGREAVSELFRFELDLVSEDGDIKPEDLIGEPVTFRYELEDGSPRYFNGFIAEFSASSHRRKLYRYRAVVVPWLWLLGRRRNCRVFQNKSVTQILSEVFDEAGFVDYDVSRLSGSGPAAVNQRQLEYCVQYRETDLDFVSRLMEEHGIFYFFAHENGVHTLQLCDTADAYVADSGESLALLPLDDESSPVIGIAEWNRRCELRSQRWSHTDYNYLTPQTYLGASDDSLQSKAIGELYDFPGTYESVDQARNFARLRIQEEEARGDVIEGRGNCLGFAPGRTFELEDDRLPVDTGQSYVVTAVQHEVNETLPYESGQQVERHYRNHFTCIPADVVYRPPRHTARPIVHGFQTATVVGPDGQEIWTDQMGRVKVQFPWDRLGQYDENSSCWMRVSQVHAGSGWGSLHLPRVGEEVLVGFLEGDPDRPVVAGRVYNGFNQTPFDLPGEKNVSGHRSASTPGGDGFNELSMDDTKDEELIRIHAQKDMRSVIENDLRQEVLHDENQSVENDRSRYVGNNEAITIKGNKSEGVGKNIATYAKQTLNLVAGDEINLQVGSASLHMRKDGYIRLEGVNIQVLATEQFVYQSDHVSGQAATHHEFKGAVVEYNVG